MLNKWRAAIFHKRVRVPRFDLVRIGVIFNPVVLTLSVYAIDVRYIVVHGGRSRSGRRVRWYLGMGGVASYGIMLAGAQSEIVSLTIPPS